MKELEELLDIEFEDEAYTKEHWYDNLTIKDKCIIYFALKNYAGRLATNGTSISRIKHTIDLAYSFKDNARAYLEAVVNNLKTGSNLTESFDIKELDKDELELEELKSKLEN